MRLKRSPSDELSQSCVGTVVVEHSGARFMPIRSKVVNQRIPTQPWHIHSTDIIEPRPIFTLGRLHGLRYLLDLAGGTGGVIVVGGVVQTFRRPCSVPYVSMASTASLSRLSSSNTDLFKFSLLAFLSSF